MIPTGKLALFVDDGERVDLQIHEEAHGFFGARVGHHRLHLGRHERAELGLHVRRERGREIVRRDDADELSVRVDDRHVTDPGEAHLARGVDGLVGRPHREDAATHEIADFARWDAGAHVRGALQESSRSGNLARR